MINSLVIQNFKCFLDQEIPLKNLTVLAGANGVGKSTVIQALLLIRQTIDNLNIPHIHGILSTGKELLEPNIKILLNNQYLLDLGNSKEIINSNSWQNYIALKIIDQSETIEFNYDPLKSDLSLELRSCKGNCFKNHISIVHNSFHYINAERLGPRNIQEIIHQDFINTGHQGEYTGQAIYKTEDLNLKLEKEDERLLKKDKESFLSIKKQVEFWMDFLIPEIQISIEAFPSIQTVRVSLRKQASTQFLHPNNIGFGITYVLPIVVSGLIANKGSMLIVENPEAHLHPKAQSRVGQFLAQIAASGIQVIIETHSEHVINGIRIACLKKAISNEKVCINFFSQSQEEENPKINTIMIDKDADLSDWPYGFFDQQEQDLAEIFRLRKKNV